jgi:hypothetical protein
MEREKLEHKMLLEKKLLMEKQLQEEQENLRKQSELQNQLSNCKSLLVAEERAKREALFVHISIFFSCKFLDGYYIHLYLFDIFP